MGGGGVSVPGPSQEERDLQRAQREMIDLQRRVLENQQAQNRILLPFLAEREGFDVTVDEEGNITSITARPDPLGEQTEEIQRLLNERSLAALRGELPVDPALERDITSQREALINKLSSQFGPGYSTASPAIEALQRYDESANVLREGARTGQLTLAEQLGITREQQEIFKRQTSTDQLRQSAVVDPLTFAGGFGQVANNYLRAQQPFIQQRQMQFQASVANNQSRMQGLGILGGVATGVLGLFSDEALKDDLIQIGSHPTGIPIYVYTRVDTGERMIGVLAQDVAKVKPWVIGERGGYLTVMYEEL